MKKIAIIGAGQLGSRHLQGVKKSINELEIWVMDNNPESLTIARERYEQINSCSTKIIHYIDTIDLLPQELDIVIIATSSKPRAHIIQSLLNTHKVDYLILEKFLFTNLNDYDCIGRLLSDKKVKAFVNTPRRLFSGYKEIKNKLDDTKIITLTNNGENWGLCCNTIHFFDLFQYLSNATDFVVDNSGLEPRIIQSKRSGYIELNGCLTIKSNRGDILNLVCSEGTSKFMEVKQGDLVFNINESNNIYIRDNESRNIGIKYQSDLSGELVDTILSEGNCDLPSYEQSAHLHKIFLSSILSFINNLQGTNLDNCPIT